MQKLMFMRDEKTVESGHEGICHWRRFFGSTTIQLQICPLIVSESTQRNISNPRSKHIVRRTTKWKSLP